MYPARPLSLASMRVNNDDVDDNDLSDTGSQKLEKSPQRSGVFKLNTIQVNTGSDASTASP